MALIVENGTGLSNADALISLAFATEYHTNHENQDWTNEATTPQQEAAIRNASLFLAHAITWKSFPIGGRDQTMPFPRSALYDRYGYAVATDMVPREVQQCVALLALYDYQNAGAFTQSVHEPNKVLIREKTGPLEEEYAIFRQDPKAARPQMIFAMELIQPFVESSGSGSNGLVGERSR